MILFKDNFVASLIKPSKRNYILTGHRYSSSSIMKVLKKSQNAIGYQRTFDA